MKLFKWLFTKVIKCLDANRLYVIQVNISSDKDTSELTFWAKQMKDLYNIDIVFIVKDMSFVELPEGYVIEKSKEK